MIEDQFLERVHQHEASVYQRILYLLGSREDAKNITQSTARHRIGESFMQRLFRYQFYLTTLLATMLQSREALARSVMKKLLYVTIVLTLIFSINTYAAESTQTVNKKLRAVKITQPPVIDGTLDDACWKEMPKANTFIDERTEKPAKNQSTGHLAYTDTAIYVALYLYDDAPDKIVARQTKDQTRFQGEDQVAFSIDPFHTHQKSDRNFFIVNPLGTKYAHIATGRAEKSEWIGLWNTAAQIVEDGWIVEMEIPWQMLDYPETTKPIGMGINIDRFQQRTGEKSWWSNLGVHEFRENDGHWVDVLPPPRKRDLKVLPYIIGGVSEMGTDANEYTARIGGDVRYEVTPQLRLIGTVNPDFDNIEQVVERIDFSYGERYVEDRRPFFSEGGNLYRFDRFFYSRRVADMDAGLNLFGKVEKNTSIGVLGTYHKNNQNGIFRVSRTFTETANANAAVLTHHTKDGETNTVGYLSGDMRYNRVSAKSYFAQSWTGETSENTGRVELSYNGRIVRTYLQSFFVSPNFVNPLGYHPFTGYRGVVLGGRVLNEWRDGYLRGFQLNAKTELSNTYGRETSATADNVFRRTLYLDATLLTRNDHALVSSWEGGRFGEFTDSIFTIGAFANATNQFNTVALFYSGGQSAGETLHSISAQLKFRAYGFTAALMTRIQRHFETTHQNILTVSYDFTPALSLGSRLIWQAEHRNVYFALRRSGYAGTDFFIIVGDPNAQEFKQRFAAKVLRSF